MGCLLVLALDTRLTVGVKLDPEMHGMAANGAILDIVLVRSG
jgi:hypothetical protein